MISKIPSIKELRETAKREKASGIILPACDYLAFYFTKPFLYLSLTPNQITVLWILIKIIAALFLVQGDYWITVIALFIFQVASIIDGVDGIIARHRKRFSLNGIYLDYVGHYLCNAVLFITLAIGLYSQTGSFLPFIPAAIAVLTMLLTKALTINPMWYTNLEQRSKVEKIIYEQNLSIIMEQKTGEIKSLKDKIKIIIFDLIRIDNPLNIMFWLVVITQTALMLWLYAAFLTVEAVRKLVSQYLRIYKAEKSQET